MLGKNGWEKFGFDPEIFKWSKAAYYAGCEVLANKAMQDRWLECEGTWFVGVDVLPSNETGKIGGIPLRGDVVKSLSHISTKPLHRAQLSVIFEGYPKPRKGESPAAFKYRLERDAAHVDGLLPIGQARRRMLKEAHAYILGLPLNVTSMGASPLVVWEGSHIIMAESFQKELDGIDPAIFHKIDLTDTYHAARRHIFQTCKRVEVHAGPGESFVIHRLALHGIAPWVEKVAGPKEGRMVAYLRPELKNISLWPSLQH